MTAPSIRHLFADVIAQWAVTDGGRYDERKLADALLASPLADIIDLAASWDADGLEAGLSAEVHVLLADWRDRHES